MILKRLKPDDTYKEVFSLSYPLAENDYILPAKIDIGKYSLVQVYIGIMPFDEGIYKIHDRRPFGHCVMYDDLVSDGPFKGKKLIDIQEIVESKSTEIRRQ